jgi:hypothetical protein
MDVHLYIILHISLLLQTYEFEVADNDVVEHFNSDDGARFGKPVRELNVLRARGRIPAGMVMYAYN